jgi:hypothetical protein
MKWFGAKLHTQAETTSIKDFLKRGGPRSGPLPLWEAAEGRLLYFMEAGFRPEFGVLLPSI